MADQCDLQIHINGQQTFFLNQKIVSSFSGKLRKLIKQEKKRAQVKNLSFTLEDFPGGTDGFELVSRFCYNKGKISITVHNVSQLYCASVFLGMTDKYSSCNLLQQSETFLEGMFHWSWGDILLCLRTCETFFSLADSSSLIDKLITTLLAKIAQNSDISLIFSSNSSSNSSPDNNMLMSRRIRLSSSSTKTSTTPDLSKPLSCSSTNNTTCNTNNNTKAWWFDDLATLSPMVIERVIRNLGAFGSDNSSLLLTKFALHYLKTALQGKKNYSIYSKNDYRGLADTAVYGVMLMGRTAFSCRALFWVMRLVTGFGLSKVCRTGLERLIGSMLDLAKLDDLLVSGHSSSTDGSNVGGVYDVNLVIRLIRVFVRCEGVSLPRLKKVGWLVDQYLAEISPDQNLKVSKFIGVAQSLPDSSRDCFDGVYRAIDIYLESHPTLSFEERSRLCGCLNYEKLSLEACKYLAKNPRIPPRVAVQALGSQKHANYEPPTKADQLGYYCQSPSKNKTDNKQIFAYGSEGVTTPQHYPEELDVEDEDRGDGDDDDDECVSEGSEDMKLNMQRMQYRVLELENLCKEMKSQMSRLVKHNRSFSSPTYNRPPRLC